MYRGAAMAQYAALRATSQAGADFRKRTAIFMGSTLGESSYFEAAAKNHEAPDVRYNCASFAENIKSALGIHVQTFTYGTACAAGNYAIGSAAKMLKRKLIDVAVAGAVDPFSRIAMVGFSRSRAMSADGICRPFDQHRNGMVLGEGAAVFILERLDDVIKRGGNPLAEIGALGLSCDAFHPTAPDPAGTGIHDCILQLLAKEKINGSAIDWICAHGSGTRASDVAEGMAIEKVFGTNPPPVAGIKGAIGHSLGAITAIQVAVCILSIQRQLIPPTVNCSQVDEAIKIPVVKDPVACEINHVLNCGYAFGRA
jgi:3-oxoacyl-[acyl-carrier-protein] synthase II